MQLLYYRAVLSFCQRRTLFLHLHQCQFNIFSIMSYRSFILLTVMNQHICFKSRKQELLSQTYMFISIKVIMTFQLMLNPTKFDINIYIIIRKLYKGCTTHTSLWFHICHRNFYSGIFSSYSSKCTSVDAKLLH